MPPSQLTQINELTIARLIKNLPMMECAMAPYNCWFFGTKLPQPVFTILHAESNGEARRLAMHILRDSPGIERVEVWCHGEFAFRVNQHQVRLELAYAGRA